MFEGLEEDSFDILGPKDFFNEGVERVRVQLFDGTFVSVFDGLNATEDQNV